MNRIGESELILNANGSIFHLHLRPENLADNVILVGDQGRVEMVSKYFDTIEKEKLLAFTKESERFAYLVELLYHRDLMMKNNPLIQILSKKYALPYLSDLLSEYAKGKEAKDIDTFWKEKQELVHVVEESLSKVLADIDFELYTKKDIAEFYENISLRRNVWLSLFSCQEMMEELDFNTLKQSRF